MKYAVLAGALAVTLCTGICEAEDAKTKSGAAQAAAAEASDCCPGKLTHIDLGDDYARPVTTIGTMAQGQNYDGNTGFPNVVTSDSDMNLE